MKEYLKPCVDGTYELVTGTQASYGLVEVPEGADMYVYFDEYNRKNFYKNGFDAVWQDRDHEMFWDYDMSNYKKYCHDFGIILWKRPTQPEELPFIDDDPKDNVNHPSHYTNGKVECIDALESATVGKTGIEAVCVANVIKYLWRYEDKNGIEDVKKAKWYLDKLLNVLENK